MQRLLYIMKVPANCDYSVQPLLNIDLDFEFEKIGISLGGNDVQNQTVSEMTNEQQIQTLTTNINNSNSNNKNKNNKNKDNKCTTIVSNGYNDTIKNQYKLWRNNVLIGSKYQHLWKSAGKLLYNGKVKINSEERYLLQYQKNIPFGNPYDFRKNSSQSNNIINRTNLSRGNSNCFSNNHLNCQFKDEFSCKLIYSIGLKLYT